MITPLAFVTLAFALGTVVGLLSAVPAAGLWLGIAGLVVLSALRLLRARATSLGWHAATFAGIGFVGAAAAIAGIEADCRSRFRDGATLQVRGVLEATPGADGSGWLRLESVRAANRDVRCAGIVRVTFPARQAGRARAGTRVSGSGRWFNYPAQAAWPANPERRGTLSLRSVRTLGAVGGTYSLARLRGAAQDRLRSLFPRRSGLAEALLIAQRGGLDPQVRHDFAASGLTHLLSISGTHVGLVAGVLLLFAGVLRLPHAWGAIAAAAGTVGYVLFLGAPHAATRAALQILLLLASRLTQRPSDPYNLLAFAGLVLLIADPLALLDPGFQLSFAGIFGLLALRRPLLDRLPRAWPAWLRDGLASGTAATLATTPIAALHFGLIAGIGILANLAAIPIVGLCVPAVAFALMLGSSSHALAAFFAAGADLLLAALARTAAFAAAVPFGHGYVSRSAVLAWLAAVGAALLALAWVREGVGQARRRIPLLAGGAIAGASAVLIVWPGSGRAGGGTLEIHAIDVGQGDAFAIRSPGGRWILVDAGPRSEAFDAGRSRVLPFLLRRGVDRVEAVIMTHPHTDHIGGVEALVGALKVRAVIDPAIPEPNDNYVRTIGALRRAGVRWYAAREGRELRFGDVVITFFAPLDDALDAPGDPNDYSVVFRLSFGRFSALFTGDAPAAVENALLARHGEALDIDLLKVGHHGSRTSTGDSLLRVASPQVAVISAGRRNRYGHPAPEVLARLARHGVRVLRTDEEGSVTVSARVDGRLSVSRAR